jgi:hypothetical protein
VNIVLDSSTNYASWRDLMEQALQRYTLITHVTDDAPSNDLGWIWMDIIVLNWICNSISADLHQVVRERGCMARHLWLAIENQFLGNREQRTLHLDAAFHTFVQGDLSINEYCRKFKAMADGLADLGAPVEDRILILNILQGLNQCFEHVGYYSTLLAISELSQSSGRSVAGGDSHGQYRASGCPDGALHQCCIPGDQPAVFHAVSPAEWQKRRHRWQPEQVQK